MYSDSEDIYIFSIFGCVIFLTIGGYIIYKIRKYHGYEPLNKDIKCEYNSAEDIS